MKYKTYSVAEGKKPFNWKTTLEQKLLSKSIPSPQLTTKAAGWTTCACGNQCAVIPRLSNGAPQDTELENLGVKFYERVKDGQWATALKVLEKIEQRSAFLINLIEKAKEISAKFDDERASLNKVYAAHSASITVLEKALLQLKNLRDEVSDKENDLMEKRESEIEAFAKKQGVLLKSIF